MWSTNQPKSQKLIKREKEIQNRRERRKRSRQKRRLQQNTERTDQVVDNPPGQCYVCFGDEDTPENPVIRPSPCNCNVNLHYLCLVQMLSRLEYARTGRCTVCRQPFRCPWIIVHLRNTFMQFLVINGTHNWTSKLLSGIASVLLGLFRLIPHEELGNDRWTIHFLSTMVLTVIGIMTGTIVIADCYSFYRAYLNWRDHIEQMPWYRFTRYDPVNQSIDPQKSGVYDPRREARQQLIMDEMTDRRNMIVHLEIDLDVNFTPMDWNNQQMVNDYKDRDTMLTRLLNEQQQYISLYPTLAEQVYADQQEN